MFHKRLLKEFKDNNKLIFGMVATQWIMLIANVILMLETAGFISAMLSSAEDFGSRVIRIIFVLSFVVLIRCFMLLLNGKLSFQASKAVKMRLRAMIYKKLMQLGNGYTKNIATSEAVQICTEGVEQLEIYFGKYMPQFFYSMLAPVTLFVIVGTMSIKVAVVLLLCVPLIPVSIVAVQKFAKKMLAKYWGTYTEMGDSFLECLQGLTTLKIYQADERYAVKMDAEAEKFRKVTMKVLIMQLNSISIMDIVAYGGAALGIILSILELQSGHINLAQCFFIVMISAEFFLPLRLLGSFFHIAMNGNAAADKIFRLIDEERDSESDSSATAGEIEENVITFDQVSFCYEEGRTVLDNVCLEAKKGMTAFVGESGCGKSTLISLIMGDNALKSGIIKIGKIKISNIDREQLRKKITRVRHDSYLFAGTVRENLLMGKKSATDEELYQVLKQVNLSDFIQENGGLDIELAERASNFSGGQKQRLAIARALLHDSDIYLFDEAASNVDVESENDIMAVVKELAKKKAVILVSHRLANVTEAEQIYVMKDGKMIESGTHKALHEQLGYYNRLFEQQMKLEQYRKELAAYE